MLSSYGIVCIVFVFSFDVEIKEETCLCDSLIDRYKKIQIVEILLVRLGHGRAVPPPGGPSLTPSSKTQLSVIFSLHLEMAVAFNRTLLQ